ncbi:MAG: 16S rRNA (guanine(966)-N(2))-methyltransferase RsmD [Gemmatimonadales bacterium]
MTRIVSGTWGGRRLTTPRDARVRPTAERVREAWLNILGPELHGARIADLFAGSGALGLEALSRGAAHATFIELNTPSLNALKANVAGLGAEAQCTVLRHDAIRFAAGLEASAFDVVLADPPFAETFAEQLVARWQLVTFAPVLAVEHSSKVTIPGGETRRWGDVAVTFLRAP